MAQVSQRDRDFILNPYGWPHMHLPLKSKGALAVLMTATTDEAHPLRILVNQTLFGPLGVVEEKTYENVDALLADGWMVD